MWKLTLLLAVLLLYAPLSRGIADPTGPVVISSYGAIGSSSVYWGAWASDTAWETYGSYFSEIQIQLLKDAGANVLFVALDKKAWDDNVWVDNVQKSYRDYIKQLVDWSEPERTVLSLHIDHTYAEWHSAEKNSIVKTPALRRAWIEWGKEVIIHCDPWGILIMDEPGRDLQDYPLSQAEYSEFADECINEFRTVDPEIVCITYGGGGPGNRDLSYFFDHPLAQDGIFYTMVAYYCLEGDFAYDWTWAYEQGDAERARTLLYTYLDEALGPLRSEVILSVGTAGPEDNPSNLPPNWKIAMKDFYDYAEQRNLAGIVQWACTKRLQWNLLASNFMSLSEIGEFWAAAVLPS